jgi:hypothetical protein
MNRMSRVVFFQRRTYLDANKAIERVIWFVTLVLLWRRRVLISIPCQVVAHVLSHVTQ